jgi:hypothetical protein
MTGSRSLGVVLGKERTRPKMGLEYRRSYRKRGCTVAGRWLHYADTDGSPSESEHTDKIQTNVLLQL